MGNRRYSVKLGVLLAAVAGANQPQSALAQEGQTGLGWSALPALNYDSDEGFGYGVTGGVYAYGDGSRAPYRWALEPIVFFTTNGRRSVSLWFDAPYQLGDAVRLTGRTYYDHDCCQPYYGFGNASPYDPGRTTGPGPNYYSYRRTRWSGVVDLQWRVAARVRVLTGLALHRNGTAARDANTLFADDALAGVIAATDTAYVSWGPRFGIVYDSRDAERDPRSGLWVEGLVWQGVTLLSGDAQFSRLTTTARAFVSPVPGVTLAARVIGEHVDGDMSVPMLSDLGSTFQDFSGVGGAETVRGVLRQRLLGRTRALGNFEVRLRGPRFQFLGAPWRLGAVAFADIGRVWDDRGFGDGTEVVHWGKGGGARVHWGSSFIIAADLGHGREAGWQTYLRLGHVF